MNKFNFSKEECRVLAKLTSPAKIQNFVDKLDYNLSEKSTYFSPKLVLKERKADCFEGAIFATAALRFHGYKPLIISLTSVKDDDHVLAVFKQRGYFGTIGKSKYTGLVYREPIHKTLRELTISYFESYFNYYGEKTLRGYSVPVDLSKFDRLNWMTTEKSLEFIEDYLNKVKYNLILRPSMTKNLRKVTPLMLEAGELWLRRKKLLKKAKKLFES